MNSRERILAAVAHREPDRIPIDLGSTPSSNISAVAYGNLKRYIGMTHGNTRIYDVVQQLAQPEEEILDRFHVDVIDIGRMFNERDGDWYDVAGGSRAQYPCWFRPAAREDGSWEVEVEGDIIARMPAGGYFFDQTYFPYYEGYPLNFKDLPKAMKKVLWAALPSSPWDHAEEPDFWEELRKRTLKLRRNSNRALMFGCGCNLFEWGTFLRRLDNFLMDIVIDSRNVEALLDSLTEIHLQTLEKVCDAVGDIVDIIRFGDDLGMMDGPLMSPVHYRKFFKTRHSLMNDYVHKNTEIKTFLHSCGSIYALLPDLIEAGFEIINPVQTNCRDMDPVRLKKEFGSDVTFWGGGCDTASVLNRGKREEVYRHVTQRLEIFSPGGGYVFNTIHNILPEVPPENVEAMFEAVNDFNG